MVGRAAQAREKRERAEQQDRARVDAVVGEFDEASPRTRTKILYCRRRIEQLVEVVTKFESREPFILMSAGPHWKPGERDPGWWWR